MPRPFTPLPPELVLDPMMVADELDPDWSTLTVELHDGARHAIGHFHRPCGTATAELITNPDGSTARLCRACLYRQAAEKEGN